MRRSARFLRSLIAAVAAMGVNSAAASATTYYASSKADPASTACTAAQPCTFDYAVGTLTAGSGDDILVQNDGSYTSAGTLFAKAGVDIHGHEGGRASVTFTTAGTNAGIYADDAGKVRRRT